MTLNGLAEITSNGLLRLTNTTQQQQGHAFHPTPLHFNKSFSFSTTFVFAIISEYPKLSAHGFTFVLSPNTDLPGSLPGPYLGLFNQSNNGNSSNHVFAVELDTILNPEFGDIDDNHVGIDVNSLRSVEAHLAGYFSAGNRGFHNLSLRSGQPMQLWVDYDGPNMELNVTLSPIKASKPDVPLMSITINLSESTLDSMYAGFSSSTGSLFTSHYILGWSFRINGRAQDLDLSNLPSLPRIGPKEKPKALTIGLPVILSVVALMAASIIGVMLWQRRKFTELMEDWEVKYGPHRFSYKELYTATRGFRERELLGTGGFGRVYKGVLPKNKCKVAIKRVSHESRQGMREFVAEIVSIGRVRHRNIVQLLGYCRDVKSSNVLLDGEMNARLGDFGLARLYDHGTDPQTTHVVGTLGYLAPELSKTGKARPSMKQVIQFLDRDIELPDLSPDYMNVGVPHIERYEGFDDFFMSYVTSSDQTLLHSSTAKGYDTPDKTS
ncbi:L-type lectin-domain containing receptor kinase IV.1 [Acorus gramineus]|uniref:non-specific serine/threonine protein kinase n=1 Tax=Acorus gramineus TaxID=55184 RepID=A0AAV9BIQ5_ACOGR|nr:L-type lectin-domain containing receptor kinase IV.1 [Acorus gramineus]